MSDLLGRMIERGVRALSAVEPLSTPWILPAVQKREAIEKYEAPMELASRGAISKRLADNDRSNQSRHREPIQVAAPSSPRSETFTEMSPVETIPGMAVAPQPIRPTANWEARSQGDLPAQPQPIISPTLLFNKQEVPELGLEPLAASLPVRSPRIFTPATSIPAPTQVERIQTGKPETVDVHVTIGHIEVRSAPAPVKPAAQRIATNHVSLKDYLQRRNEGNR